MSDSTDPSKSPDATPEQLLKMLDLQIAMNRSRRRENPRRRATLIAMAVLLIVGGALAALLILQQMVADLPQQRAVASPAAGEPHSQERQF
jgi:hypothetical protein